MFITMNRYYVPEENLDRFEMLFRDRRGAVENAAGFKRSLLLRPYFDQHPYILITFWDNQAQHRTWVESPEHLAILRATTFKPDQIVMIAEAALGLGELGARATNPEYSAALLEHYEVALDSDFWKGKHLTTA